MLSNTTFSFNTDWHCCDLEVQSTIKVHKTTTDLLFKRLPLLVVLTHSVPQNEAIVPHGCAPAARGTRPSFRELDFCCLGNYSNTETCFKTNFLPMKRVNSITSYCVVLTFESTKIRWLVREILVSEALEIYFSWIIIASIKFMTRTMDECAWFWVNWGGGEWNCVRDY